MNTASAEATRGNDVVKRSITVRLRKLSIADGLMR
jgi:hypothetical protein